MGINEVSNLRNSDSDASSGASAFEGAITRAMSTLSGDSSGNGGKKNVFLADTPAPGGLPIGLPQPIKDMKQAAKDKADKLRADVEATKDPVAIKALDDPNLADISNTGVPLANIASITKESDNVLDLKTRDGKDIIILKQATPYLFDGMAGKMDAVAAIQKSETDGYKLAGAGDNSPGLADYKNIGPADEVGPGFIRYETLSGDKVIVSKEVNPDLYEKVKTDGQTWGKINDSKNDGYRLAGKNESADGIKVTGTPEELGNGLIRYETDSGQKIIVSQEISPDLYNAVVKQSDGLNGKPGAADTEWIDNSKYAAGASAWNTIAGDGSGKPTQEQLDLNRPNAAAKMISDNWDAWGLHGEKIDFSNPPSTLPPEAQAALKYVSSSPSLMAALDAGGYGKTDGVITHADVDSFIKQSDKDVKAASDAYGKFLKNNPDATDLAKESAKSAAILMGNISLVSSAGPEMQGDNKRASVGDLDASNLNAIKSDPGLSGALTGAAGFWSSPGMLRTLDVGGDDPATYKADGIVQQHNIGTWLEKQAPASDDGVLMMMNNAAVRNSVADVDTSKLTADVLQHPENYDGKTKAAVLVQLTDTRTRLQVSNYEQNGTGLFDKYTAPHEGLNPNEEKVDGQLKDAINKLQQDPDVTSFLTQTQGPGLKAITDSNPEFKVALQHYQDTNIGNGNIINTAMSMKDNDGKTVPLGDALQIAASDMSIANMALGGDGKVDLVAAADKSGKSAEIQQYFKDHILSGKDLQDAIAKEKQSNGEGADLIPVIQNFAASATVFQAFLGDKISKTDSDNVQTMVTEALSETLVDKADGDIMKLMFGDANGNFDEAKAKAVIDSALAANPDLFKTTDGQTLNAGDVMSMVRSMWDVGRQQNKIGDTLPKVISGLNLDVSDAYKQGLLHIGSALLAGGVLIANSVVGGNTPTADAERVASGLQFAGLMMEGGSKYAKEAGFGLAPKITTGTDGAGTWTSLEWKGKGPLLASDIKDLGNIGKLIGGAGSFIGGVLGLVGGIQSAFDGDALSATLSLTGGIFGTSAAVTSLIEGGAGLFGATEVAEIAGAFSGILGEAAAIFGGIGSAALPVVLADHRGKLQDAFYGQLVPVLEQYGLTGGPEEPGDNPPDPIPAINT
jgi:hypothetical protein